MNYFELFDLEQQYDIDIPFLKKQYLNKQVLFHPDKARGEGDKREYLEMSMSLNKAYKILIDDYTRAEYLLTLLGQKFDDRALKDNLSASELSEILDQRELLEDMEGSIELRVFEASKVKEKSAMIDNLSQTFRDRNIVKALDLTVRLKYLTNLVKNIRSKIKHANS